MLWSTSPTGRVKRGKADLKDIAKMPIKRRVSKVFNGYAKTIEPATFTYASKSPTNKKEGRYQNKLAQHRERSLLQASLLQSSFDNMNEEE